MSNVPTLFKGKQAPAIPSALWNKFNEEMRNIADRQTVPSLSPGGKKWTVSLNGEKTVLRKKDSDGDLVEMTTLKVIVVGVNPNRSRSMYEGPYVEDDPKPPVCWSNDGIKPDASIESPKCSTCKVCPMTVKGSKTDERGMAVAACQQMKFLAVLPYAGKIWEQPLRLKLSITSVYDGKSPDLQKEGWYAWDQYVEMLRSNGIHNTALVVTKMKFDPSPGINYPKIIFSADDYCSTEQLEFLAKLIEERKEDIDGLTSRIWTPAGVDGVKADEPAAIAAPAEEEEASAPDPEAAAKAEKAATKARKAAEKKAAAEAAAKAAEAAAAAAKAAAEDDDDDDDGEDGEIIMPGEIINAKPITIEQKKPAAEKKKTTPPAASADVPDALKALVGEWANT